MEDTDTEVQTEEESEVELEARAIDLVTTDKKRSLEFYEDKFKQFNYFDRLYIKGASKTNVPYGRANLELPLAFQQVEPFVSQMTETMVGEAPYIAYEGRNAEDDQVAEEITDFTQYQLESGGFVPAFISFERNIGKYGTAILKPAWETEIIEITDEIDVPDPQQVLDPSTGLLVPQMGTKTVTETKDYKKHDGPVFYNVSIFDFFIPPSASSCNVQKMEWCIHRTYRSLEELLQNPNYNKNRQKIEELILAQAQDEDSDGEGQIKDRAKKVAEEQKNPSKSDRKYKGKVEVLERWGDFKFKKTDIQATPSLIVVALINDEKILLRLDENPFKFKFKPFIMTNDYVIEGEPYGYGELHHIKGLIDESTALRNARLDVANLSLNRTWLVSRQAGVNIRELYTAPNKIILTNDLDGLRPLDMGQVTPSSVNELARIDYDIQNTTEIINPRQDVSNVGAAFGGTATGVNFLSAKSNLRLLTKARLQEETFFKPLAMMLNWYNRDLITSETYYRVAGEENPNPYRTISPDAFLTEVDFKPTSNPQKLSIAERKDNMGYLLQAAAQVDGVAPGTNNFPELMKIIYKLAGFPHPDRYVNPPVTTVFQDPQGQLVDLKGSPVNIQPLPPPKGNDVS